MRSLLIAGGHRLPGILLTLAAEGRRHAGGGDAAEDHLREAVEVVRETAIGQVALVRIVAHRAVREIDNEHVWRRVRRPGRHAGRNRGTLKVLLRP